jgi:hypothetical protein
MPLYPLPPVVALLGWICIAVSSGWRYVTLALAMAATGAGIYLIKAKVGREWPFAAL